MIPQPFDLDPASAGFLNAERAASDLARALDVCRTCKLCATECTLFQVFFAGTATPREAADACCQCRRCVLKCPHAPEAGRGGTLDLPGLILRERIARRGRDGAPLARRFATNPDLAGAAGVLAAPLVNRVLRNPGILSAVRRYAGIGDEGPVAPYARTPFDAWFRRREGRLRKRTDGSGGEVALFLGCTVNHRYPEIARAALDVLTALRVRVLLPEQRCCGAALLEGGDLSAALENAALHARVFRRHAEAGRPIIAIESRCGFHWRAGSIRWKALAQDSLPPEACLDLMTYLWTRHRDGLAERFPYTRQARIFYHEWDPDGRGSDGLRMLRLLPRLTVASGGACRRGGMDELLSAAREFGPDAVVTDDLASAEAFRALPGGRARHAIEVLADLMAAERRG